MLAGYSEQLTAQFYDWEQRGRGWAYCADTVELEPYFVPFTGHYADGPASAIDDGKQHTVLSLLASAFKRKPRQLRQQSLNPDDIATYALSFECYEPLKAFAAYLTKGQKVEIGPTEQLLLMLSYCAYPLSFEIIGSSSSISFQLVTRESDAIHLQSQVKAYFPECIIKERADLLEGVVSEDDKAASILHFGLRHEFMRPLRMADNYKTDPLAGLLASMEHLQEGEHAVIQILFQGAANPWAESIMRAVTDEEGDHFFLDAPDMLPQAKEKVSAPLFGVCMRVMGVGHTLEIAHRITDAVGGALGRLYFSETNSLIPLSIPLEFADQLSDMLYRESHLTGMLLNGRELATMVHLPSETVASEKLERTTRKTKLAPAVTDGHATVLGLNEHHGKEKTVTASSPHRLRHTHLIGATGTGKSTLLHSLIVQDIQQGNGVALLDPHGDLFESILPYIPESRYKDVILIDPADAEYPVGFNILEAHSEIEKEILASDLVAVFKRLSSSWGDQMNSVFGNAILAILESSKGGTLLDLRRFLVEKSFRDQYLKGVADPSIVYYWQKEYPLLKGGSIGSILTRLDIFLRSKVIRNMVAQRKSIDFESILDTQKIVLIKLSQGLIGTENSYLLGTFFVTKIYQAAMARQAQAKGSRKDFFFYIDEFQHFITPSMSHILSGARKYHLGLILAHQDMAQLTKYDSELASSVVSNAGTRICFRLGDTDAKRFASGFSAFEAHDLENLNTGEAIARIERSEQDFSLSTIPQPAIDAAIGDATAEAVIAQSRTAFGTPKQEVEQLLQSLMELPVVEDEKPQTKPSKDEGDPPEAQESPVTPWDRPIAPLQSDTPQRMEKSREETHHRSLQLLVKRMAEARGYKALIEELTPDGNGRVDVHLEKNTARIAIEICSTTEPDWEVHNLEKCIAAGYSPTIACSSDKRTLDNIRRKAEESERLNGNGNILYMLPDEIWGYLDQQAAKEASTEVRTKGYRVKVEYAAQPTDRASSVHKAITKTVARAISKKKTDKQ